MIIRIFAVGKIREIYWQQGISDYSKRLKNYARLEVIEVPEARTPDRASPEDEKAAMAREGQALQDKLSGRDGLVVALDRKGMEMGSLDLARWIEEKRIGSTSAINWVIGGPLGLDSELTKKADLVLSFSKLTFPHQMMRLLLLEQIYRSFRIIHKEPYHR